MSAQKKVLIVNDDGIAAPGLIALVERLLHDGGFDIRVVAPENEQSGVSHCLTLFTPLLSETTILPGELARVPAARVAGTPVDCVKLALDQLFPDFRPDWVLSGINRGPNHGRLAFYSGTFAGALEAALQGIPAIALSLSSLHSVAWDFPVAARVAVKLIREITAQTLPRGHFLAVEIPNLSEDEIRGIRLTRQGTGTIIDHYREEEELGPRRRFRVEGKFDFPEDEVTDADTLAVRDGWVAVTPYALDLTAHAYREEMRRWALFRNTDGSLPIEKGFFDQ
ncbi:MAG: 5'/3'-nucleotidase SurE [Deltaproteobacteria bacterium]|nr:5'/3'-nucleotidase SurE [Deltaproteobacteria bacterium]